MYRLSFHGLAIRKWKKAYLHQSRSQKQVLLNVQAPANDKICQRSNSYCKFFASWLWLAFETAGDQP